MPSAYDSPSAVIPAALCASSHVQQCCEKRCHLVFYENGFGVYPAGASANRTDWQRQIHDAYPSLLRTKCFAPAPSFWTGATEDKSSTQCDCWEDGGTLGLGGCQGQFGFGMFRKKYVAYSCRTGNNAQSPSQSSQSSQSSPLTLESHSASQQGSLHRPLYASAVSFLSSCPSSSGFFETNSLPPSSLFHARGTRTAWWRFPPLRTSRS